MSLPQSSSRKSPGKTSASFSGSLGPNLSLPSSISFKVHSHPKFESSVLMLPSPAKNSTDLGVFLSTTPPVTTDLLFFSRMFWSRWALAARTAPFSGGRSLGGSGPARSSSIWPRVSVSKLTSFGLGAHGMKNRFGSAASRITFCLRLAWSFDTTALWKPPIATHQFHFWPSLIWSAGTSLMTVTVATSRSRQRSKIFRNLRRSSPCFRHPFLTTEKMISQCTPPFDRLDLSRLLDCAPPTITTIVAPTTISPRFATSK
mmetsp:Transcript_8782/g.23200  ORF Transcript_8782/g.23200 Transcript_8782/m.23200 type:complete len:259 (-) Transcript_8782:779-1555(-)